VTTRTDVVVIGGGLGGLACAADLAARGVHVVLLERHGSPGGYATAFTRGQFTFDVSQHSVGGLREGQSYRTVLDRLGVEIRLAFPPLVATFVSDGATLPIPNDRQGCMDALASVAPDERKELEAFLSTCASIHRDTVEGALDGDTRKLIRGMRIAGDRTFQDALASTIRSERLRAILSVPWMLLGLPPSRASFSWFAKVIANTLVEGTAHILGGGLALSEAIAARIRTLGSEVRLSTPAVRVVPGQAGASAVETQAGETIEARAVVGAVDPWTLASLVEGTETALEPAGEPSLSMFAAYLGLKSAPALPEGTVFVKGPGDPEKAYRASLQGRIAETDIVISSPSPIDDGYAPPGKAMVHAVALTNGRPWFDYDAKTYLEHKREALSDMLARIDLLAPGLSTTIEVQEAATPRTMHGYTRNHLGAVYGLAQTPAQSGARRPGATTPIPGLFRTGAWVLPGGGYLASTLSGVMTARDVARHLGLADTSSRRPAGGTGSFQLDVFYEDTDTDGVTYHVSYLRFFDRARTEMFMQLAKERGITLPRAVVKRIEVGYLHPSTLGDAIEIRTRGRFESDFRVVFEQEALRGDLRLAEAVTELVFVDGNNEPIPCPVREQIERG